MTRHSKISFAKSGIRIEGFACLPFNHHHGIVVGAILLILAEAFGIWEEIGAEY